MRFLFPVLAVVSMMSCASCRVAKDLSQSPAEIDQNRIVLQTGGTTEVGIHGTINPRDPLFLRSYAAGTVTIRGMDDCGFIASGSTQNTGWVSLNPNSLPRKEFCLFSLQARTNGFDAPVIGHFLVRRFLDPNVLPLRTKMNLIDRDGVNWVQIRANSGPEMTRGEKIAAGINEDREIVVYLGNHSGRLNITGCGLQPDVIEYTKEQGEFRTSVDNLYRELRTVSKSCVFTITANHDDALKESATVFVKVYEGIGSFLDAPVVDIGRKACFSFVDPFVVGVSVNKKWRKGKNICVDVANSYTVEGVTSKHRVFYGEHDGQDWTAIK